MIKLPRLSYFHALSTTRHNRLPVIDEPPFSNAPELCGLVLKSHLLVTLKGERFTEQRTLTSSEEVVRRFKARDFAEPGLGKGINLEDLELREEEMEMYVDLHPITSLSSYTVLETTSLAKVSVLLFRELGLRHMCVVPKTSGRPPIVGILTQHDFMPERVLELYPHLGSHE